ncbi:MAG TPA: hypothetical protein VIG74_00810 [Alphaproteobacteria bacterium]
MNPDDAPPPAGEDKGVHSPTEKSPTETNPPPLADLTLAPHAQGLRECLRPVFGELPLDALIGYLKEGCAAPADPADMEKRLETQARVLDSLFGRLVEEALKNKKCNNATAHAALKSQKHYRDTIRAQRDLGKIFTKLEKERDKKTSRAEYWMPENGRRNKE